MPRSACPVTGCSTRIPRHLFMCGKHWRRVPPQLQEAILDTYRAGVVTQEYLDARRAAIAAVEAVE